MKTIIRQEEIKDYRETENLVREAFWNVYRPGCLEHFVLHSFRGRQEFARDLDFVMEADGALIGQVMFVRNSLADVHGRQVPILSLGPIGILPEYQRKGYGKQLLDYALEQASKTEAVGVFLEGNINFYGKSGFVVASSLGIRYMDEPEDDVVPYFLCKALKPECHALAEARYRVPRGYFVDEAEAAEFDDSFPPKERLRLPGQLV